MMEKIAYKAIGYIAAILLLIASIPFFIFAGIMSIIHYFAKIRKGDRDGSNRPI